MKKSYTKYKIQFKTNDDVIQKALEKTVKSEYEFRRDVNEVKRCINGLFENVEVEILAVSRYTRIRKLS
jgi:hypothetical protein